MAAIMRTKYGPILSVELSDLDCDPVEIRVAIHEGDHGHGAVLTVEEAERYAGMLLRAAKKAKG